MAFWKSDKKEPVPEPGLSGVKYIVAVGSGKGGVGKSTVAVNLAVALREQGATVGLMDTDIYGPSQPGLLGAAGAKPDAPEGVLLPIESHGVKFVSMGSLVGGDGPVIWRAPMAMKIIHQFLAGVAWGKLDYVIIDLPPGTGDVQLTLAQQASLSGAVIVTTPQDVALGIAKKGLKMFEQVKVPILGVIENMSGFTCEHCGKETAVFKEGGGEKMAGAMKVPFLGSIPLDPKIMMSGDDGVPVVTADKDSAPAKAFLSVAKALRESLEKATSSTFEPEQGKINAAGELLMKWKDGHESLHRPYTLRVNCQCAVCLDEDTRRPLLDPKKVALDIRIESFDPVGRYAITAHFSDGHRTGIYPYERLRELCECETCAKRKPGGAFTV